MSEDYDPITGLSRPTSPQPTQAHNIQLPNIPEHEVEEDPNTFNMSVLGTVQLHNNAGVMQQYNDPNQPMLTARSTGSQASAFSTSLSQGGTNTAPNTAPNTARITPPIANPSTSQSQQPIYSQPLTARVNVATGLNPDPNYNYQEKLLYEKVRKYRHRAGFCEECTGCVDFIGYFALGAFVTGFFICFIHLMNIRQ